MAPLNSVAIPENSIISTKHGCKLIAKVVRRLCEGCAKVVRRLHEGYIKVCQRLRRLCEAIAKLPKLSGTVVCEGVINILAVLHFYLLYKIVRLCTV